jgi:Glycosyl hydrolase family 20, catalytic domain
MIPFLMPTEYITEIDLQLAGRGHGVIDDHHRRCAESVTRVEEATLDQPNSERFKEVIANHLVVIDVLDGPAFARGKALNGGIVLHRETDGRQPSFTHSYYLLGPHEELSEVPGEKWPDTYCPSNPKSYELLFDVYDEYIDLLKPKMIHTGHDELFIPVGLCPRCGNKDIGERFGEDVRKIHDHLASKGVQMAIWGDMLLEGVRGKGLKDKKTSTGFAYKTPGGMTPEQVQRLIPKDILIFNWFWNKEEGSWSAEEAEQHVEWAPILRQPVKTQFSLNGEESHEHVSKAVQQRIQRSRGEAAGTGGFPGRGGAGL